MTTLRDLLTFDQRDHQPRRRPLLRTMVGDVLRRTRLDQGRTLSDVARSARISMQYLSELERGRKEASSEILAALCVALHLDLSELLAAVGRDLLDQRGRPAAVIRLQRFLDGVASAGGDAPPEAAPSPPAGAPAAPSPPAGAPAAPPAPSSGDAMCRLAA